MANLKKLISIFASLALALSLSTSGAANAAGIDDPSAFEPVAAVTVAGTGSVSLLSTVEASRGKQISASAVYSADLDKYKISSFTTGQDGAMVQTDVITDETKMLDRVTGVSLIRSDSLKKFVLAWSGFSQNDAGDKLISQIMVTTSANGTTWSKPVNIAANRSDSVDAEGLFGGFSSVQLFNLGKSVGAIFLAKAGTKATDVTGIQFVSSANGTTWSKAKQVNSTTSPLNNLRVRVAELASGVNIFWDVFVAKTETWSLFTASASTKAMSFGAATALLSKLEAAASYTFAKNSKDDMALAFIDKGANDDYSFVRVLRKSAAGAWTAQSKGSKVTVADTDVFGARIALNSKGELLVAAVTDDGDSYLSIHLMAFDTKAKQKGDEQIPVTGAALTGMVLNVYYDDAGNVNMVYDALTDTPLDIEEEMTFASNLTWLQGNLTDGFGDPITIGADGDPSAVIAGNVNVTQYGDFELTVLGMGEASSFVNSYYMQQAWAPAWGEEMPSITPTSDDKAFIAMKGGKVTLTLPTDVKAKPAASVSFAWYTCTKKLAADQTVLPKTCVLNKKATKNVYVASATDKGKYIVATVTATNALGSINWISQSTGVVK